MEQQIYLDYHATTPCDPRVVEAMLPYFGTKFANPSSAMHASGRTAAEAVERGREQVANLIGAQPNEIVFTSGATESNNLALLGCAKTNSGRRQIVTTPIEHKSVLEPCKELQKQGFEIVMLPIDKQGRVIVDAAKKIIDEKTLIVSVQAANNEIGTIQPVAEMAAFAHEQGALVHCDAAQAVGKILVDVFELDVDFLSISGHKLYGPKGVGALFLAGGAYTSPVLPLFYGGGQERNLRPGTLNVPGIVGLGTACELCYQEMEVESRRIAHLRDLFETRLLTEISIAKRNGAIADRLPGNSSLTFASIDAEALIVNTPNLALSTGSACTSGAPDPSHILLAIGLTREEAYATVRVGIGRFTTEEEINQALNSIVSAVRRLGSYKQ